MPFELPFQLRVLHALTDSLKQITPANGFVSDLADFNPGDGVQTPRVYRGRMWFGDTDPATMVSIIEGIDPADEVAPAPIQISSGEWEWSLIVQGWTIDDPLNPTDPGYVQKADVQKRLAYEASRRLPGDPTESDILGIKSQGQSRNSITKLTFGFGNVRPADEVSSKAWWWLPVTLTTFSNPLHPYD